MRAKESHLAVIKPIVRESKRAKYVRLKISVRGELTIVIPYGFDRGLIPDILRQKRSWIEKVRQRIEQQRKFSEYESPGQIPKQILLRAVGQKWSVKSRPTTDSWISLEECDTSNLLIHGNVDNYLLSKKMLQRWIAHKARQYLVPWLHTVSDELGMPFTRTTVRNQRTRWGSCTRHKSISLNQKLLFFPSHLVRYIFIHEICHTVHLNHSSAFWALVREKDPQCEDFRNELRTVRKYIPEWSER